MKTIFKNLCSALALALFVPGLLSAAPAYLDYQGRLVDTAGNPLLGPYSVVFSIFDAPTGGNKIWEETQPAVTTDNGIFNVSLGSVTPLPAYVFSSDSRYLEVTVGGDSPMTPRTQLRSVPYAITAGNLGSPASVVTVSTHVVMSASQLRLGNFAAMPSTVGEGALLYDSTGKQIKFWNGSVWMALSAGGVSPWLSDTGITYASDISNYVGVGTVAPLYKLQVSSGAGETGTIMAVSTGTSDIFRVTGAGEVYGNKYYGDGSALTGIVTSDKVAKSGDTMTGTLVMNAAVAFNTTNQPAVVFSTNVYVKDSQLRVGNFATAPPAGDAGKGAVYYDTVMSSLYVSNGSGWTQLASGGISPWATASGKTTLSASSDLVGVGKAPAEKLDVAGNIKSDYGLIAATGVFSGAVSAASFSGNGATLNGIIQSTATGIYPLSISGDAGNVSGVVDVPNGGTGLSSVLSGNIIYTTADNTFDVAPIDVFGLDLIDTADAGAARTLLALVPGTNIPGLGANTFTGAQNYDAGSSLAASAGQPGISVSTAIFVGGGANISTITPSGFYGNGSNLIGISSIAVNIVYTEALQNLAVTSAKLASGIDAAKIGGGLVTTAKFDYLSNITSDVQAQLNSKSGAGSINTYTSSQTITAPLGLGVTYGVSAATMVITNTGASALDVAGGINAGSGNVGIVDATGKIPALSATYLASLDGSSLLNVSSISIGGFYSSPAIRANLGLAIGSDIPGLSANTFTGAQNYGAGSSLAAVTGQPGVSVSTAIFVGSGATISTITPAGFYGNGANLSGIIQSTAVGTYPLSISGNAATATNAGTVTNGVYTNTANTLTGTLTMNAASAFNTTNQPAIVFSTHVYMSGSQLRVGNFAVAPGAGVNGAGSIYYNTGDSTLYFSNGISWSALASGGASPWGAGGGMVTLGAPYVTNNVGVGKAPVEKLDVAGTIKSDYGIIAATGAFSGAVTAGNYYGNGATLNGVIASTSTGTFPLTAANVTTNANLTGDVTSVGNATTLTAATVTGKAITGFVSGAAAVLATDTILQAINKLDGNTNAKLSASGGTVNGAINVTGAAGYITGQSSIATTGNYYGNGATLNGVIASTSTGTFPLTAANVTTNANLTGDVTSVGNATTLTAATVTGKAITGYVSGAGVVAAADTVLQAIQKLNGNDATNANLTGDVTSVGNATTLTAATVTGKAITGFVSGAAAVLATDTILQAINKLDGNDALKLPKAGGTMTGTLAVTGDNYITGQSSITTTGGFFGNAATLSGNVSTLNGNAIMVSSSAATPMMMQSSTGIIATGKEVVLFDKQFRAGTIPVVILTYTGTPTALPISAWPIDNTGFTANGEDLTYNWIAIGVAP